MRIATPIVLVLSLAAASLSAGCQSSPRASSAGDDAPSAFISDETAVQFSTATLTVRGLSCPQCAHNVDQQLLKAPGVQAVEVDLGAGEVHLKLADSPKPTRAQLARAIDQAGFTLVNIEAP